MLDTDALGSKLAEIRYGESYFDRGLRVGLIVGALAAIVAYFSVDQLLSFLARKFKAFDRRSQPKPN
jgi:hypothetical protein